MNNLIEMVKKSGGILLVILVTSWVMFLVILELLVGAAKGFPSPHADDPAVFTEIEPSELEEGCIPIGDTLVCGESGGQL